MATETRTYMAGSVASSRTILFSVLTIIGGILAIPELAAIIPLRYAPYMLTVSGVVAVILRLITVRPVAFVAPGNVVPVEVPKIDPPASKLSD